MFRQLEINPLNKDAFAPFGDVIEIENAERLMINDGTAERFNDLADIDVASDGGRPIISIFRGRRRRFDPSEPIEINMMERHPLGSQAFVPLQDAPYLVVVARIADHIGPDDLYAFLAQGKQGVNYRRNLWHHPLLVLNDGHEFLVIDRGGPNDNCVEQYFTPKQGYAQLFL